ncbi:hypothetical protein ACS0TY_027184 [Phlomoides rotata]
MKTHLLHLILEARAHNTEMISSLGIHSTTPINYLLTRNALQTQILSIPTQKRELKLKPWPFSASSSSSITEESSSNSNERNQGKKKLGVVVKPMGKPRLVFRFIWMEKNIGIMIDQVIPGGRGIIPVSLYYFWPKKDAWEELKVTLETKHWISYKHMVTLLNHASEIIRVS